MKHQYKVDIRWSGEDEVFVARVPELDGVVTHGSTVIQAAKMAEEAIELHLETLAEENLPAPKPVALADLPGKYLLRMGRERHEDVFLRATAEGKSVNDYLNSLIDREQARPFKLVKHGVRDRGVKYKAGGPIMKKKAAKRLR